MNADTPLAVGNRNNGLFALGLQLRKTVGDGWEQQFLPLNAPPHVEAPLPDVEVQELISRIAAVPLRPLASAALQAAIVEFQQLDDEVNTLQEILSQKKDRRKTLGEIDITDLVQQEDLHLSGCRLDDDTEYTFERDVKCGIKNEHKPEAFGWLAERNVDHMLKHHIVISFPKDSVESAKKVRALIAQILPQYQIGIKVGDAPEALVGAVTQILQDADLLPAVKVTTEQELPGATLSAFVKKCLVAGITMPAAFGVFAPLRPHKVIPPPTTAPEPAVEPTAAS
jgi:hypothetical protein